MHDIMNKPELKSVRKDLRNMSTSAEATLWKLIKGQQIDGLKFRRQHSVGPYILDFYCPQFRLGIELDGEVHSTTEAMDYADNRARFLVNEKNIWVIRFENRVVFENPTRIVEEIREVVKKKERKSYHLPLRVLLLPEGGEWRYYRLLINLGEGSIIISLI